MYLSAEVGRVFGLEQLGEVEHVPVVQLEHLADLPQHCLRVGLRVAVQEKVVAALRVHVVRVVLVSVDPDLLLSAVPAQRQNAVKLGCCPGPL